jgi:hypothetical protein
MPPKKARSEKNQPKISFFTTLEKENPWSEDETDTGTTTEANEPIEVDDNLTRGCHRFYYLAPFTVFYSFSHPFQRSP